MRPPPTALKSLLLATPPPTIPGSHGTYGRLRAVHLPRVMPLIAGPQPWLWNGIVGAWLSGRSDHAAAHRGKASSKRDWGLSYPILGYLPMKNSNKQWFTLIFNKFIGVRWPQWLHVAPPLHGVLNEVYLQFFLHGWAVNRETNLMSLLNPWFATVMLQ
jgi:hypothetical protein